MRYIYVICFFLSCFFSVGQGSFPISENRFSSVLDSAKRLMDDSLYFKSNEVFLDLLDTNQVLPDEICFLFGKSLFLSGYKDQSRVFLYKYLALKDTSDQYYLPTQEYLILLGENIIDYNLKIEQDQIQEQELTKKIRSEDDPCHGEEVFICPVCNGTTVIVRKTNFGTTYQTCPYCTEEGIMDCSTYEKYLRGELKP